MNSSPESDRDVAAIARISAVPTILQVITETTHMGFAFVARVTEDEWRACAVRDEINFGMAVGDHLQVKTTLCHEVHLSQEAILIEHASAEPEFCNHPTPKAYGFESYLAVPLYRRSGEFFGTLCALDRHPEPLRATGALQTFNLFARLISLQLEAEEQLAVTEAALAEERRTAELRNQFMDVLGHDLRSPLSAIQVGASLLRDGLPDEGRKVVQRIERSAGRIERLVGGLLDVARGRLGGGLPVELTRLDGLAEHLRHVVDEQASVHPSRPILVSLDEVGVMVGDRVRLEQVVSNLLANAIVYGQPGTPISVELRGSPDTISLRVHNHGSPIPDDLRPHLFQPFVRGRSGDRQPRGLGLGLFIVHEIVRAHGGEIAVTSSSADGTAFCCSLPRHVVSA